MTDAKDPVMPDKPLSPRHERFAIVEPRAGPIENKSGLTAQDRPGDKEQGAAYRRLSTIENQSIGGSGGSRDGQAFPRIDDAKP